MAWRLTLAPLLIEILDARVELVDNRNSTGQLKRGVTSTRGDLERVRLQKSPNEREGFYAYGEDNDYMGFMTVTFDEAAIRPTQAFCTPMRLRLSDTLDGLLLVPTGEKRMEFKRVGYFDSDDSEVHNKLATTKRGEKVIFTIVGYPVRSAHDVKTLRRPYVK